jgi:hypothetical protein
MFTLDQVVPWGRSFDEYRRMFALTEADLRQRILGCGDGPAGFNAEATRRGGSVTSCDPIYQWDTAQIRDRIALTYDQILDQTRRNAGEFVWDAIPSVEALGRVSHGRDGGVPPGLRRSPYVDRMVDHLRNSEYDVSIDDVPYEFQRGGNQMMRIRRPRKDSFSGDAR